MTDRPGIGRTARPEVPFRLDLDQQKKRAKELLRGLRAGDPAAVARLRAQRPHAADGVKLADAQFVVARELGCPDWARLKAHVAAMETARAAIAGGTAAPDGALKTLHIRCGSDIQATLRDAGFTGDFLEYSNPFCHGPVPEDGDLLAVRARFITAAYGGPLGLSEPAVLDKLRREEDGLARANGCKRVVLWFEHDTYDQLILARCLAHFAEAGAPPVLELVSINHFPGAARFIGLGQLPAEAIRMLWEWRRPVAPADLAVGWRVWAALRSADPNALAELAGSRHDGLPDLPRALHRHLQELPWTGDGLSLTERLILKILAAEDLTLGWVYSRLMSRREPLPWLTDLMFLAVAEAMAKAREPAFTLAPDSTAAPWPQWRPVLTEAGRAVLAGTADGLALDPPERWVGGVRIAPGRRHWRWDDAAGRPVWRPS
ncbi:MAG TPA: DUF1835 domain-containing protein [Azospirillum sp.]|nr:DUF1835 domain-containing protein [Azospirillum sp.]